MSLYECDPRKHKKCRRKRDPQVCGLMCIVTTVREYSTDGRPLSDEEIEEKEREIRFRYEPGLVVGRHTGDTYRETTAAEEEPDTELDARPEAPAAAEEADE